MGRDVVRVVLVDDHEVVRRGVADLLEAEPDIEVVGEAGSVAEALARVPALRPDVAVLDVRLPDGDGVGLCRELRSRTEVACLVLTSFDDDEALFDAILAGAAGYVLKQQVRGTDLVAAIRTVAAGGSTLDPRAAGLVMERLRAQEHPDADPLADLTEQERRVLALVGQGLTNRQIGERLFLAEKTVKNYVSHVLAKLGVERRVQAAVLAARLEQRS
jgi:two-component system response regulator DevR